MLDPVHTNPITFYRNPIAVAEFGHYTCRYDCDDRKTPLFYAVWVESILPGDTIQIVPMAYGMSWTNIVSEASIKINTIRRMPLRNWIDAVFINQQDMVERSEQAPIMNSIYQIAEEAHVWLGSVYQAIKSTLKIIRNTYIFLKALDLSASGPRDKLYALLPLGKETSSMMTELPAELQPDYEKLCEQVYARFTRWLI
ncbi:hypothetical protein DL767_001088 [Monosporascus sp. MG133]|nr:hypothetical protein DL767_001088 [Monosporascus sp. MG133]